MLLQQTCLGFFTRRKYEKVNNLIEEITRQIEKESGWKYIDKAFVLRSNFSYDPKSEQIEYTTNRVEMVGNVLRTRSTHPKEMEFAKRYTRLLARLLNLEEQKEQIERDNLSRIARESKVSQFHKLVEGTPAEQMAQSKDFVQHMATDFYNKYGNKGMCLLVIWLNNVAESRTPMQRYEDMKRINVPEAEREAILSWISTYSKGGEIVFDRFMREKTAAYNQEQQEKNKEKVKAYPLMGEGDK